MLSTGSPLLWPQSNAKHWPRQQTAQLFELLQQNTQLTEIVKELSLRIETLTIEMHGKVIQR